MSIIYKLRQDFIPFQYKTENIFFSTEILRNTDTSKLLMQKYEADMHHTRIRHRRVSDMPKT
jgi:hypothetical protein